MKAITKAEARQFLILGHYVKNVYYSDNEYLFINNQGKLETEDECIHGTFNDEFWTVHQNNLKDEWYVIDKPDKFKLTRELALEWWRKFNKFTLTDKYFPNRLVKSLTGGEIEEIWRKETQLENQKQYSQEELEGINSFKQTVNQKQFKQFNNQLYLQYLNKFSLHDRYNAVAIGLLTLRLSIDEISTINNILLENRNKNAIHN